MMRKLLEYTTGAVLVLTIALGLLTQSSTFKEFLRTSIIQYASQQPGLTLNLREIRITPFLELIGDGISLSKSGSKMLTIEKIRLKPRVFALWQGYLDLHQLEMSGVKLYIPKQSRDGPSLETLQSLPLKFKADALQIDDFSIYESDGSLLIHPIHAEGRIYADPGARLLYAALKGTPSLNAENWLETEIAYEGGIGSLQIVTHTGIQLHAEFVASADHLLRISRFHASANAWNLDGNAVVSLTGEFKDSSILFTSGELSENLPIQGYLYGEGKMSGSIWCPEVNLNIYSDQLEISDQSVRNVEISLLSHKTKNGLFGDLSLSFIKEDLPFKFSGRLFWDESLGPVPNRLRTHTDLALLVQLLAIDATEISGDLDIELKFLQDNIAVHAELSNGSLESYSLGSTITRAKGLITGDLNRLELSQFSARDGGRGTYSMQGFLLLDPVKRFPFEASVVLNNTQLINLDHATTRMSGTLKGAGNLDGATLEGRLSAQSAKLTIIEDPASAIGHVDVTYLNYPPSERAPTPYSPKNPESPLHLNIQIAFPEKAKIKSGEFTSQWQGDLLLAGTPTSPLVSGELSITDGKYSLRGRNLKFNQGTITFGGDLEKKITLYLIGEMEIDRYKIEIIVKGPAKNPAISFRSNPPLSRKEILSWILFNKDISEISEFQGGQLDQSMMTLSANTSEGSDPLTRAGKAIGVDRIGISGSPAGGGGQVSFEVGKYISENTYISLSRRASNNFGNAKIGSSPMEQDQFDQSNRVGIETSLGKYFKLQAEIDQDQCGQINLLWKRDY